jgi:hypothetical protein
VKALPAHMPGRVRLHERIEWRLTTVMSGDDDLRIPVDSERSPTASLNKG